MEQLRKTLCAAMEFGERIYVTEKEYGNIGIIPRGVTSSLVVCDLVAVSRPCDTQKRRMKLELKNLRLAQEENARAV